MPAKCRVAIKQRPEVHIQELPRFSPLLLACGHPCCDPLANLPQHLVIGRELQVRQDSIGDRRARFPWASTPVLALALEPICEGRPVICETVRGDDRVWKYECSPGVSPRTRDKWVDHRGFLDGWTGVQVAKLCSRPTARQSSEHVEPQHVLSYTLTHYGMVHTFGCNGVRQTLHERECQLALHCLVSLLKLSLHLILQQLFCDLQ